MGTTVPGQRDLVDTAVIGYELAPAGVPAPPPDGDAWADRRLAAFGVRVGQQLRVGPGAVPVRVRGWVRDTNYLLQGALWVAPATWRRVQDASRPDAQVASDTFEVLVVRGNRPPNRLARDIDAATNGAVKTLTKSEAVLSSPGTREQRSTFAGIIGVTFLVVGLVIALFFVLLTIERTSLYGVLKALGTPTSRLVAGLVVQALIIGAVAFFVGEIVTLALGAVIPAKVPLILQPARAGSTFAGILVAAMIGSLVSLRRIARADPISAIGAAT